MKAKKPLPKVETVDSLKYLNCHLNIKDNHDEVLQAYTFRWLQLLSDIFR